MNDPSGISGQLIPPDLNASTASPNMVPSMSSLPAQYIWHTAPESHAKIQEVSFNGAPCWHVWLPDGTLEEFGCTDPSRQTALDAHGNSNVYAWDLNLIVDPHGNQIRINYTQYHIQTTGMRDAVISSIEYDDPTCHNRSYPSGSPTAACSSWNPQVRIVFDASTTVSNLTNPSGGCANWSTTGFRCDDAVDLSGSGGLPIANVMSIYVLNDIKVEVQGNLLNEYVFSYNQGKPQTITDPASGKQESVAGYLLLTQIQQLGTNGTALNAPVTTITYTEQTQHYEDLAYYATPSTNCGPSWTPRNSNGCFIWDQSYNSYYIQTYDNGAGWHENITWKEARNNTHGVDSGAANNTFTCDGQEGPGKLCGQADDENWSRIVVLSRSSVTNGVTSTWNYQYSVNSLVDKPCSNCSYGYTWGNQNDNDFADFYNGQFTSFANATVTQPDGSYSIDYFASTGGWGLAESSITCDLPSGSCNVAPYWNQDPGMAGNLKSEQDYNSSGQLMQVKNLTYAMNCPPTGVSHSNNASGPPYNPGNTELISELDQNNPVVVCDPRVTQEDDYQVDGVTDINNFQSDARVLHKTIATTYDGNNQGVSAYDYGNVSKVDTTANDVGGAHFVAQMSYYPNDNLGSGIYLTNLPAFAATLDGSGTYYACSASIYGANTSASQAPSTTDVTQSLGYLHPSGGCAPPNVSTAYTYDSSGNPLSMTDADGHQGCTLGSNQYSACVGYDSLESHVTSGTNAADQVVSYQYNTSNAASGYGEWLLSTTDVNGNATTYTYDALGRVTSITKPGDSTSTPTLTFTYNNTCSAGSTTPCLEIDTTSLVEFGESQTTTTKQWYDGLGRLVETQTPGPNTISGNPSFIVTYTIYDKMGNATTKSLPYAVTATGYVAPDLTQPRTVTGYDSLGRPLGGVTYSDASTIVTSSTINYTVAQGVPGFTGDSSTPFEQTIILDSYNHEQIAFTDALGRQRYSQVESGTGSPYTVVRTLQYTYDTPGELTSTNTYDSNSHLLAFHSATYDGLGQVTGWNDADSGACSNTPLPSSCSSSTDTAWKETYDNDGNVLSETDPRGQTTYTSYDALDRPLCTGSSSAAVNPCSSNASELYFYDDYGNSDNPTVSPPPCAGPPQQYASDPVGEKTSEIFSSAAGSGWRCFGYTDRGEQDMSTLSITVDSQTTTQTVYTDYTELGQVADLTYPDGEIVSSNFDTNGYFQGMSDANGAIASNVQYTDAGQVSGMTIGGVLYQNAATTPVQVSYGYDAIQRPISTSASVNGNTLFNQSRTYDNVGNVINLATTVPTTSGGSQTDNQAFCYDALDRLVWAGNNGTPTGGDHCGTAPSGSTTTSYQQTFGYDALDRFTTGPAGTTSYTDASHTHAVTNVSSVPNQYASYDAMGNMTCRNVDTTNAHSCDSTQSGATMTYDNQARLASWTAPSGTSSNEQFLYDNEGNRVLQRTVSTIGSTTTVNDTITFDGYTQTSIINGASPTTIKYYSAAGHTVAMTDGSHWYTLLGDGLGSTTLALKGDGTVQAVQLYAPFGSVRSTDGTMPTPRNYTGQLLDDASGLLYDNARYYDPLSGNFTSADAVQQNAQGMNPYLYVAGNPETLADPSGARACTADFSQCAPPPPPDLGNPAEGGGDVTNLFNNVANALASGTFYQHSPSYDPFSCGSLAACFGLGTQVETTHTVHVPAPVLPTEHSGIFCSGFCGITFGSAPSPQTGVNVIARSISTASLCISVVACVAQGGGGGEGPQEGGGGGSDFGDINFAFEGSDVPAGSEADAVPTGTASEGNAQALAQARLSLGMPPRSTSPDDGYTLAILKVGEEEYWGMNGAKPISFSVNAISKTHAEIDALDQLVRARSVSGSTGGIGEMLVDRPPCPACGEFGGIRSGVRAARLDRLDVWFPGGTTIIYP